MGKIINNSGTVLKQDEKYSYGTVIEFVEEKIGFPITMISNGPSREDIIYR